MRIPRLYYPNELQLDAIYQLDKTTTHYIANVLRLKKSHQVYLFNGFEEKLFLGEVVSLTKQSADIQILSAEHVNSESHLHTHIGQVMSKGDRMDYAIQKATEMGVSCITPLSSTRCEIRLNKERLEKKQAHWQQVAISACEQCGRTTPPQILLPQSLESWLALKAADLNLILDHRGLSCRELQRRYNDSGTIKEVRCVIGPEGGFCEEEILLAETNGFEKVKFGPRVLRTETVPSVVLTWLQLHWGDLQ